MKNLIKEYVNLVLKEKSGEGGANYELQVFDAIKLAGASGKMKGVAGFDANLPDADITVNGQVYNVEVKMNGDAQMGGGSVGWKDGIFFPAGKDLDAMESIADALNASEDSSKVGNAIKRLCNFLSKKSGKKVTGFPMSGFLKSAWYEAVSEGLLVPINVKLNSDVSFISEHYRKKGTFYIQIGGQGLFHLGENPAGLPVPKLAGEVTLEIRAGKGGSGGKETSNAGLRVQPRLKISQNSPYSLDDPESIREMLNSSAPKKKEKSVKNKKVSDTRKR